MKLVTLLMLLLSFQSFAGNQWIQRSTINAEGRHRASGMAIGNKAYIGLGHYNGAGPNIVFSDWWEYDPATNAWTQKADINYAAGLYGAVAFGLDDAGYILFGSGFYKYTPSTNSWSNAPTPPSSASNVSGFVIDDKCYVLAGNTFMEFNHTTSTWSTKASCPSSSSSWNSSFSIGDKGYIKNGTSFYEYKQTTDQWIVRASFPGLADGGSASFSQYGKGYIVAGYDGFLSPVVSEVWEYIPETNQWNQLEEFPGTSRRFACGITMGNRCYLGTGTNGTNFNDFWEFDAIAGLEETFDKNQFTCYPNPASSEIHFKSDNLNEFEICLFNNLGQRIQSNYTTIGQVDMNLEELPSGLYLYQVIEKGTVKHSDKLIVK